MKIIKNNRFILYIGILLLTECCLTSYIGWWRSPFWETVSNKHLAMFLTYLGYFSVAALLACWSSSKLDYYQNMLSLSLRNRLTNKALLLSEKHLIEGYEQRIQQDCFDYPIILVKVSVGIIRSGILLCVFLYLFYSQLGASYLPLPFIYAIIGTIIAGYIAKPLININYNNQQAEAKFRRELTKLAYLYVFKLNVSLFKKTKSLAYFQYFYNQITVIIPYLMLAIPYFTGKIIFGTFMQCAALISQITDCLSYFINSFNDINKWLSCRKRLKELGVI